MKSFLVETYTPASTDPAEAETRARVAADGTRVRYARSVFVPADEICFHLLDGPSAGSVADVVRQAGISAQRILEVQP